MMSRAARSAPFHAVKELGSYGTVAPLKDSTHFLISAAVKYLSIWQAITQVSGFDVAAGEYGISLFPSPCPDEQFFARSHANLSFDSASQIPTCHIVPDFDAFKFVPMSTDITVDILCKHRHLFARVFVGSNDHVTLTRPPKAGRSGKS